MTTYDDIYSLFMVNCNVESLNLPDTPEKRKDVIKNAVMLFNNRLESNVECDEENETFSRDLNDSEKLIIAHFIKLTILKNIRTYKNSLFTTFTKEIGIKNINAQLNSLKDEIEQEEETINMLIFNIIDDNIM